MARDFTNRRGKRPRRKEWWQDRKCYFRVFHSDEFSYLVRFPFVGPPAVWAYCPRCWGLRNPGHFDLLFFRGGLRTMKKPPQQPTQRAGFAAPIDDLIERLPTLAEFLTATAYDGDPPGTREVPTLLIFGQDGSWKACLRDRQEQRTLWVSTNALFETFEALENALCDPGTVWRADRMSGAPEATRQKTQKRS